MGDQKLILPQALTPQIQQAMWLVGQHPSIAVAWGGVVGVHEQYRTEWPDENTILIYRDDAQYDSPCMEFRNIHFPGIGEVDWTGEDVISDGEERHSLPIQGSSTKAVLPEGASITQPFSYTFTRTDSLLDSTLNAIQEGITARVGGASSPAGAGLSLDVTQQYTRTFGQEESETTTVGDTLTLVGPGTYEVVASRGVRKARRRVNTPLMGDWSIVWSYYGHQVRVDGVDLFNDMISGRAPDNVGVFPDTLGGATGYSFAQWARSRGQLGSLLDKRVDHLDEAVEYATTYDEVIRVIKNGKEL